MRSVFQPIVDLGSGLTVGFEALTRGPSGSPLERPDRLFEAAAEVEMVGELDWACRASAVRGALDAGLGPDMLLFVNAEPLALATPRPPHLDGLLAEAAEKLRIVVELTERGLDHDPAALVRTLSRLHEQGFAVALDDLGANPLSLAFLPILAPDVIKLDMNLVKSVPHARLRSAQRYAPMPRPAAR